MRRTFFGQLVTWVALTALALALPSWLAHAEGLPGLRETFDVRYYPGKGRQKLDVFAPAAGAGLAPVVLFVHGGTWMMGDKDFFGQYRSVGRYLARHGIVAVLVNYRLSPAVRHPEHVKDVARAFAWVRKHVRAYGGDPDRIVLCGHSAGGHLVSLLATDATYLSDPALKLAARDRSALRAVMSVCGVYRVPGPQELKGMVAEIVELWIGEQKGPAARFAASALLRTGTALNPFRLVFGDDRDVQQRASPLSHVRKALPPFLLLYAESEVPGLATMAVDFGNALRKAGNVVELREVPGTSHSNILFGLDRPADPTGKALLAFVQRHAAPKAP